jgi:peptidoglycan/LPS O-acetylase OafA/YrhL
MPFIGGFGRAGINVTWSLAIEEQFYLTLPLIVRRVAPKNLLPLVVGIVVGAPILRALLIWYLPHGGFAAYVLTPCRADALGLGVLCAILVRGERSWSCLLARRAWICASAVLLGLAIGGITLRAYPQFSGALYGTEYSVLALFYATVLLIAVTGEGRFVKAVFCNSVLRRLGFVAYGTYLLHSLFIDLFVFLANFLNARYWPMHFRGAPLLGEVVAVAIAALSWRYFEKPLVRKGHAYLY